MATTTTTTLPFLSTFHHRLLHLSLRNPNHPKNTSNARFEPSRCCSSSSSSSSWEREEARWQREEQRWLREEQRWLREEARWLAERDALLAEAAALRRGARSALESGGPHAVEAVVVEEVAAAPVPRRAVLVEEAGVKEMMMVGEVDEGKGKERRRALRSGAQGDDVRAMQVRAFLGTGIIGCLDQ